MCESEASAKHGRFPGRLTHQIQALLPIIQRPSIAVIDLPGFDAGVALTDIFYRADSFRRAFSQLALINLALNEEGNLIV